jgi:hypothetical protein
MKPMTLLAAGFFVCCVVVSTACSTESLPTINVSIGMSVEQLRNTSTYPFKAELPSYQSAPGHKTLFPAGSSMLSWIITTPYNLIYTYNGYELKEESLGGSNYLIAITTDPEKGGTINLIQITFQNRTLTLDEALLVARRLNDWFTTAGFHIRSQHDPEPGLFMVPFYIGDQERHSPRYTHSITSYKDARTAFLDPQAKVIRMIPFDLETDDVGVGLEIVNGRRLGEDISGDNDESNSSTEREYHLDLSIGARPQNRRSDSHQ